MRNWKKKTLGGVLAAAMLVSLVPATSALAADDTAKTTDSQSQPATSCSVNFRVNGYVVQAGTGVGNLTCDSTIAQAVAAVKGSFNVPSGKVISGWTLNGAKINTGAKLSEPEFATNAEGLPGGAILDAVIKDAPQPAKTFVVTVHANGGTFQSGADKGHQGDTSFTVTNGSKFVSKLPKVSRLDHEFVGWTYDKAGKSKVLDSDFISANTEVYAQWKAVDVDPGASVKTFTLTVHTNAGTIKGGEFDGQTGDIMTTVGQNEKVVSVAPSVARLDYVFTGWSYDQAGNSPVIDADFISADTEIWAQWKAVDVDPGASVKTFTLTVSTNGGTIKGGEFDGQSGDVQTTVGQNQTVLSVVPTVVRDGYVFKGWSTDKDGKSIVAATDVISADTQVYAQWTKQPVRYTVVYSTNGGNINGEVGDFQLQVKKDETLLDKLPTADTLKRDGFTLKGWTYAETGTKLDGNAVTKTDKVTGDLYKVVARWEPTDVDPGMQVEQFNVVYNTNGGNINGEVGDFSVQVAKGDTILDKLPTADTLKRDGYVLKGWVYAETGTDKDGKTLTKTDVVDGNVYKLVAQWTKVVPASTLTPAQKAENKTDSTKKKVETTKKAEAKKKLATTGAAVGGVAVVVVLLAAVGLALRKRA